MKTSFSAFLIFFLTLAGMAIPAAGATESASPGVVRGVRVADAVNPVMAGFIAAELDRANADQARAFLLEIDTPGGLDTAMRTIIQRILGSPIPVIVYVYPP